MAGTITPLLTKFTGATSTTSDCEAATDWSGTPTLDPINNFENAGCLSKKVSNSYLSFVYTLLNAFDFTATGHTHIYVWMMVTTVGKLATREAGGMRIRVEGATTGDYKEWYVGGKTFGGKTDYAGGWKCFVIDTTKTPDASAGTVNLNSVPKVGVGFLMGVSVTGNVTNCFWDVMRQGSGLQITGGTSGTPGIFQDILDAEDSSTNKYGILRKEGGVLFCSGELIFGDVAGTSNTYFTDTGQVLMFEDKQVNSALYKIKFQGNGTGITQIYFGDPSTEVSGLFIKSVGTAKYTLTATDTNVTKFGLLGCTFNDASTITLPVYNADKKVKNCNFEKCAEVIADTCLMTNCNFISSVGRALRISSASHNVTSCNFINCQTAIHHNVGGSSGSHLHYDYSSLMFTGGTYHIENSASTPNFYIDIDRIGTPVSNPDQAKINNSNGGSTTILAISVQLTLTGLIAGSDVRIMNAGTTTVLASTDNSGTTFVYSYNYGEYPNVDIVVLHLDYEYFRLESFTPGSTNASMPIPLRKDRWYANP